MRGPDVSNIQPAALDFMRTQEQDAFALGALKVHQPKHDEPRTTTHTQARVGIWPA